MQEQIRLKVFDEISRDLEILKHIHLQKSFIFFSFILRARVIFNQKNTYFSFFTAWSPALRTGTGWSEYLLFDFIGVYRINRLKVQTPQEGSFLINYREVESVTIEISNSLPFFNYITEKTPDVNSLIVLDAAVETRYIKLGIKAKMDNPDASPIGIYK